MKYIFVSRTNRYADTVVFPRKRILKNPCSSSVCLHAFVPFRTVRLRDFCEFSANKHLDMCT